MTFLFLHYLILFYSYSLDACLFLLRNREGVDPDGAGVGKNWEELGKEKIRYMKNIYGQ